MFGERHYALLLLSKPSAKTIQWSGSPQFWLTPSQKKDKRMVKSITYEHRPKKVHIQQNPSEVSEGSNELAIEAEWRRPRLRSRKRGGGTATPLFVYFLNSCKLVLS